MLWVGGAFRSEKYPVTWTYNADHENVRKDFVRDLIDHAHAKGIKVPLGFTPFGYDGVNRYTLDHSVLKAMGIGLTNLIVSLDARKRRDRRPPALPQTVRMAFSESEPCFQPTIVERSLK